METSRLYYYLLKVAGISSVMLSGYVIITSAFFPGEIRSAEPLSTGERFYFAISLSALCLFITFGGWRSAYVRIQPKHLEVVRNGKRLEVPWAEVSGISKLPFTSPPMYWIKFYDRPSVAVIPWSWIVISVGFWAWDFSPFRDNLEVRIAEAARELNRA